MMEVLDRRVADEDCVVTGCDVSSLPEGVGLGHVMAELLLWAGLLSITGVSLSAENLYASLRPIPPSSLHDRFRILPG